jgi:hypothetical protein
MSATAEILRAIATVQGMTSDRRIRAALHELAADLELVRDRLDHAAVSGEGLAGDVGGVTVAAELIALRMSTTLLAIPRLPQEAAFDLAAVYVEMIRALREENPEPFCIELRAWLQQRCSDVHATVADNWARGRYSPEASVVDRTAALN